MLGFNAIGINAISVAKLVKASSPPVTIAAGNVPAAHRVIFPGGTKVVTFPGGAKTVRF